MVWRTKEIYRGKPNGIFQPLFLPHIAKEYDMEKVDEVNRKVYEDDGLEHEESKIIYHFSELDAYLDYRLNLNGECNLVVRSHGKPKDNELINRILNTMDDSLERIIEKNND